jgi:hypothetical protein
MSKDYIFSVDPGNIESAYSVLDEELRPIEFGKVNNEWLRENMLDVINKHKVYNIAIEMIASYGMAVGATVFDTCVWIGRFTEVAQRHSNVDEVKYIYRKEEKMNLCGTMKAKDSNIRQALIDRFGVVGTKGNKGWFYGVSNDVWAAIACGTTYSDLYLKREL